MSLFDVSLTDEKDYLKIVKTDHTQADADDASPDSDSTFPNDPDAPFGFAGFRTIDHNLGYVPLVRGFWDPYHQNRWYSSRIMNEDDPFGTGDPFGTDPWLKYIVTTSQVKLIMNTNGGSAKLYVPIFFRIYEIGEHAATSDRAIDKIFESNSSSSSITGVVDPLFPNYKVVTLPHTGTEPPIWTMQFSEDQTNWYGEGLMLKGPPDLTSGPPGGPYATYYQTSAAMAVDADNVYIFLMNNYAGSKTIYFRYKLEERE
jgi:hypothetical protein